MSNINLGEAFYNFASQGFHVFHFPEIVRIIDIDTFGEVLDVDKYIDNVDTDALLSSGLYSSPMADEQRRRIQLLRKLIEEQVLRGFDDFNLVECGVWRGVDDGSIKFHNDGKPEMNCTFLAYLSDMDESVGGSLDVCNESDLSRIHSHYPKAGDLVWLNQAPGFMHRANRSTIARYVAGFDYIVKDIQ